MKISNKYNINRKIAIVILIILIFNLIFPIHSHAGLVSIITKPLQIALLGLLDSVNVGLSLIFALDSKKAAATVLPNDPKDENNVIDDDVWNESNAENLKNATDNNAEKNFLSNVKNKLGDEEADDGVKKEWGKFLLSPDDIFAGNVGIADANIFDRTTGGEFVFGKILSKLKDVVSGLYYNIRNLSVVLLLCLLIFSGIRIVLASNNPGEKAVWKSYLMNWVKALALVMFIHVIMIAIFYIADVLVEAFKGNLLGGNTIVKEIRTTLFDKDCFDNRVSMGIINHVWICNVFNYSIFNCVF